VDDVDAAVKDDEEVEVRRFSGHERVTRGGWSLHPIAPKGVDQAGLQNGVCTAVNGGFVTRPSRHVCHHTNVWIQTLAAPEEHL
jgi:hypothetical protein